MAATTTRAGEFLTLEPRRDRPGRVLATFVRRKPLGAIGVGFIIVLTLVAVLAPVLAPSNPLEFHTSDTFRSPDATYVFGTDEKGRDILSRVIYGARISLEVGVIAAGI